MVDESDLTYTQHITTSNSYLNWIHISQPTENYRHCTERFCGEITSLRQKLSDKFSISRLRRFWSEIYTTYHNISWYINCMHIFTANLQLSSRCWRLFRITNFLNNSSTPVIQRSIFNISMVNESDPTYTQHITTSNSYLDRIHILQPFENYRRVTKRYFGENVATPEIKQ